MRFRLIRRCSNLQMGGRWKIPDGLLGSGIDCHPRHIVPCRGEDRRHVLSLRTCLVVSAAHINIICISELIALAT